MIKKSMVIFSGILPEKSRREVPEKVWILSKNQGLFTFQVLETGFFIEYFNGLFSGSLKGWDRLYIITQFAAKKLLIYQVLNQNQNIPLNIG